MYNTIRVLSFSLFLSLGLDAKPKKPLGANLRARPDCLLQRASPATARLRSLFTRKKNVQQQLYHRETRNHSEAPARDWPRGRACSADGQPEKPFFATKPDAGSRGFFSRTRLALSFSATWWGENSLL